MSLHAQLTGCHGRDTDRGREVVWRGECECGWIAEREHSTSDNHDAYRLARRDYRAHVEQSLGAAAYYEAPVACRNCGAVHTQGILVGTHVSDNPCSRCGTTMIEPDNETWHESQRARSR